MEKEMKKTVVNNVDGTVIFLGRYKVTVGRDSSPSNPRVYWDNLGEMVCYHRRYILGDHSYHRPPHECPHDVKKKDIAVSLPLYLYDHSGITMKTTPFSCPWDSGQVGYIYATKQKIREEYGVKRVTKKLKDRVKVYLQNEVLIYDKYLRGDVYFVDVCNLKTEQESSVTDLYDTDIQSMTRTMLIEVGADEETQEAMLHAMKEEGLLE